MRNSYNLLYDKRITNDIIFYNSTQNSISIIKESNVHSFEIVEFSNADANLPSSNGM